jgi:hypothetical protein
VGPVAATIIAEEDIDGGLPMGVLSAVLIATTIKVEEDVNGGTWPLCLNAYCFLQATSQIAVIALVRFRSRFPDPIMTDSPWSYYSAWVIQCNAF